jgi:hypothetical protein
MSPLVEIVAPLEGEIFAVPFSQQESLEFISVADFRNIQVDQYCREGLSLGEELIGLNAQWFGRG